MAILNKKKKFIDWQLDNKEIIIRINNIINNGLHRNNLVVNEKKNLYEDIVCFMYENIK